MCALSCHLFQLEWSEGVWAVLSFLRLSIPLSLFSLVWSEYFPPRQLLALLKFLWVALKMKLVIANISRRRVERLTSALLLFCLVKKKKKSLRCLWDFLAFKRTSWTLQRELKKKLDFETSHAQVCQRLTLKAESITLPLSLGLAPQNRFFSTSSIFLNFKAGPSLTVSLPLCCPVLVGLKEAQELRLKCWVKMRSRPSLPTVNRSMAGTPCWAQKYGPQGLYFSTRSPNPAAFES